MPQFDNCDWFKDVEVVVRDPLRFKLKLGIGEDAYTSLRLKKNLIELWDTAGAAATGVGVAKSSLVASAFFAPSGALGFLGIGAAVTPIGWVALAGVVSAGAWVGLTMFLKDETSSRVKVVPDFINTPLDLLALGLFDLLGTLAVKLASIDGDVAREERELIETYFINEWGLDPLFVHKGLSFLEGKVQDNTIKQLAFSLAEFKKQNPDCNYASMSKEIMTFLQDIAEADAIVDEREEMAIERVRATFEDVGKVSFSKIAKEGVDAVARGGKSGLDIAATGLSAASEGVMQLGGELKSGLSKILPKGKQEP